MTEVVDAPANPWQIAVRPEGDNQGGENKGGMVVYLYKVGSSAREEVGRAAFDRDASASPEITFEQALGLLIETAKAAQDALVTWTESAGVLS